MKRIIDGITYNVDTSTVLAKSDYETDYRHTPHPCTGTLYQTRGGAFFVHEQIQTGVDREVGGEVFSDRFEALSAQEAEEWMTIGDTEVFHNPFTEPPEAVAETEPAATIYLRVPAVLKKQVDEAAKDDGLSANSWAMRCMEECLKGDPDVPKQLVYIFNIAATVRYGDDIEWDVKKYREALVEIAELSQDLSKDVFKSDDLASLMVDDLEIQELRKKYAPYSE